jgi:autotransporter-associated beta strand protein
VNIGIITGASTAELKKKGSGTLVLNGTNNTYEGDTTISEGKVQIKDEKSLGANAAKLILDGGVLQVTAATNLVKDTTITTNNGTIDTTSQNVVLEGKVSGVGQLIKSGAGTLTLKSGVNSGDNTFEGGVAIKEGTLEVSKDSALGKDGGSVVIDGATLAITGSGDNTLKRSITLTEEGGTVSVAAGGKATLTGELQLDKDVVAADLTKAGAGELALTKDNTTGTFKGNTIIKEGTLGVTSEKNLAQGKLFLDGGNLRTNADITKFSKDIILNGQGVLTPTVMTAVFKAPFKVMVRLLRVGKVN